MKREATSFGNANASIRFARTRKTSKPTSLACTRRRSGQKFSCCKRVICSDSGDSSTTSSKHDIPSGASRKHGAFEQTINSTSDPPLNLTGDESGGDRDGYGHGGSGGGGRGGGSAGGSGGGGYDGYELPEDLKQALAFGSLTQESLRRYFNALKNPLLRLLMAIPAYRTRALADSAFFFKLMVQELIGNGTALASEIAVRGKDIVHELEYVASDLIVGTVVEAAFVWLLAPTLSLPSASGSSLSCFLSSLPSNIFQRSTAIQQFTLTQRAASFVYAGIQYTLIGFVAGIVGTAITYGLIEGRKRLDKTYEPERPMPAVIPNSAAWGVFMGVSSNTRFQLVEGLELGIAKLFAGRANSVVNGSIIALRFANNYWGGVQFVQFFRYLGLHATGEETDHHMQE
ncbi:hypothetical protein FGB62_88g04 [Gracilaria domingensis]|nr:hypothetical protein FGB62_88g04 [Gracilaria domingensis]